MKKFHLKLITSGVSLHILFLGGLMNRGAARMRTGQGILILRQVILGNFRPLWSVSVANALSKDTFRIKGRGCKPTPPRFG